MDSRFDRDRRHNYDRRDSDHGREPSHSAWKYWPGRNGQDDNYERARGGDGYYEKDRHYMHDQDRENAGWSDYHPRDRRRSHHPDFRNYDRYLNEHPYEREYSLGNRAQYRYDDSFNERGRQGSEWDHQHWNSPSRQDERRYVDQHHDPAHRHREEYSGFDDHRSPHPRETPRHWYENEVPSDRGNYYGHGRMRPAYHDDYF